MNATARPSLLRNLQIGFGLSLLILIVTSVASYSSIHNLLESARWVDHTDSVINELESVLSTMKDAETGQRGYLLTSDTAFLRPYNGAFDRALSQVDQVQRLTADNPTQQQNIGELRTVLTQRLTILQDLLDRKQTDNLISIPDLKKGFLYMNQARTIVKRMQDQEHQLLVVRVSQMKKFSGYTPALIIIAALLSLLITIFFYRRVHGDYLQKAQLQDELERKDREITRRIDIIQGIAGKISAGDYSIRVTDEEKDGLGSLSVALNKMAESLEYSFGVLADKEWLQTGVAKVSETMVGETDMKRLVDHILEALIQYSRSSVGALYISDPRDKTLVRHGEYALDDGGKGSIIRAGEGLAGQCVVTGKTVLVKDITSGQWTISLVSGALRPVNVIVFPFIHEKEIKGVIELGSLESYTSRDLVFFRNVAENIGVAVNSMQDRVRLQELLEETQAQTEELQAQHSEMENLNMELEAQAEKLQVSEEELKVQQEELMQTNLELEEKTHSLEEKNHLVVLRNLDIQKKAEELAQTTKYKSEFMANMSHELRTPLNSILLLSRLLAENGQHNLSSEQIEYAHVIQTSGHGLLQLIDEILDLSRIESGKLELEHSLVAVEEIMDDMRMLFAPLAKDKGLELNFIVEEGLPSQLETDKMRLEQILKNLLSNAFKFTPRGHITVKVAMSPLRNDFIDFTVKDSGIGIPREKHQLIFEAFQQADGSTRRKYGGTGLGLSISLQLVKLLGGEISLASEPNEGSEFRVSVPLFKTDPSAESPASGQYAGQYSDPSLLVRDRKEGHPAKIGSSPFTVETIPEAIPDDRNNLIAGDKVLLIVEDDTNFAKALLEFCRRSGYKGVVGMRGDTAIAMARTYKPIGILLDIQLPVRSGWEVMEDLKKDPLTRHIPVHIISSFEVKNESILKGAVDFVSKAAAFENMGAIFKKIEEVLNRSPKKVLIVEDNARHAQALAYFLGNHNVRSEISDNIPGSMEALQKKDVDCVILDMPIHDTEGYEALSGIKKNPELENIPIIVFTGRNISKAEELRLKQYADSIVVKTAHSYQRILDEVSIFLHLVDNGRVPASGNSLTKLGGLDEVLKDKTVLIADDDVRNIFSLTRALERHKMKVLSAMDGKEALALAEKNAGGIDIILMDMMMPEMDGYEATTRIKRNPALKKIPVIAVTAKAMAGDREKCIQAGASDYISKPVDSDQLISLLRIWLYEK